MFNFDEQFFVKHQKKLLFIANNRYLRWLLGLNRLPRPINKKTVWSKITPSSLSATIGFDYTKKGKIKKIRHQGYFFTRPRFAEALAYNLSPFCYFANFRTKRMIWRFSPIGLAYILLFGLFGKFIGLPIAFIGTTTDYAASTGDGFLRKRAATSSGWSATRDATTATEVHTTNTYGYLAAYIEAPNYLIYWLALMFDTSGIPADNTISSSTLNTYVGTDVGADLSYVVVQSSQGTWNSLATGDFNKRGSVEGSDRATSFTASAYKVWTLNSTGLSWIARSGETKPATASATGKTQLALREGAHDIDNLAPTVTNGYLQIYLTEDTSGTKDPYLSVTYSASSTIVPSRLAALGVG